MGVDSRVLRYDLRCIDDFAIHHHPLEVVLQHSNSVFRRFALPESSKTRSGVVRDPIKGGVSTMSLCDRLPVRQSLGVPLTAGVIDERPHSRKSIASN